jgi:hypothetical protein
LLTILAFFLFIGSFSSSCTTFDEAKLCSDENHVDSYTNLYRIKSHRKSPFILYSR